MENKVTIEILPGHVKMTAIIDGKTVTREMRTNKKYEMVGDRKGDFSEDFYQYGDMGDVLDDTMMDCCDAAEIMLHEASELKSVDRI